MLLILDVNVMTVYYMFWLTVKGQVMQKVSARLYGSSALKESSCKDFFSTQFLLLILIIFYEALINKKFHYALLCNLFVRLLHSDLLDKDTWLWIIYLIHNQGHLIMNQIYEEMCFLLTGWMWWKGVQVYRMKRRCQKSFSNVHVQRHPVLMSRASCRPSTV